jgi:hypothetical protein
MAKGQTTAKGVKVLELGRMGMIDQGGRRGTPVRGVIYGSAAGLATALILGLAAFVNLRPAAATSAFARQTGLPCGRCHVNPAGGGARTAFGDAFAANGDKLPSTTQAGKPSGPGGASPSPSSTAEKSGKPSGPGGASPSSSSAAEKSGKGNVSGGPSPASSPTAAASTSIVLDYAQAQAWSLRHPYYSHFLYSPDDYRD